MELEFILMEEDYIKFNIHNMNISETYRKSIFIQRYILPIIFLIVPFVLAQISKPPFLYWMIVFGILFVVWICYYKKYLIWKIKRIIKRRLKEGKNNGVLGKRIFEIRDNQIIETTEHTKEFVNINSVEKVIINEEYIFIYINSMQAYIIPLRVFKNGEEEDRFRKYIECINKNSCI